MANVNFKVDADKCIHCGLCAKDCISKIIDIDGNMMPQIHHEEKCIACQHCMAICPVGALSVFEKDPDNSEQVLEHNPDMILNLIKSRRSQRLYKRENVSKEKLDKLKDMLKWIPTGCNNHKLHFSFIDELEVMDEFRTHVNDKITKALTEKTLKPVVDKFAPFAKSFINGEDLIFRNAPHLLVVSNSITAPCAREDVIIALSYFELYANSMGLGTCWCGFGEIAMKVFPELSDYLEIPEGYQAGYMMLFGDKVVNYPRSTQPQDVTITSATKKGFKDVGLLKSAKHFILNNLNR